MKLIIVHNKHGDDIYLNIDKLVSFHISKKNRGETLICLQYYEYFCVETPEKIIELLNESYL